MTCPIDIHRAFSEILYWTMLEVRGSSTDKDYCFALADHAHNIPHLIDQFDPKRFFYYWECERECFVRALERQDRKPHSRLAHEWTNLEPLYTAMRATHHVAPAIVMEVETGLCEVALNQEHIERLLAPARGVPQFRVLDCECSERRSYPCLLYTSPSPRDLSTSRMPSSA